MSSPRRPDETFECYRFRIDMENKLDNAMLRGKSFWVSRIPRRVRGKVQLVGSTYHRPEEVRAK